MSFLDTHANRLGFVLDERLGSLDGVRGAVLLTADGLLSSRTSLLDQTSGEELAAIAATLRGAAQAYSRHASGGAVRQVLVETDHHLCLITQAGENALLLVQTTGTNVDIAAITTAMGQLAVSVGNEMRADARQPAPEAGQG